MGAPAATPYRCERARPAPACSAAACLPPLPLLPPHSTPPHTSPSHTKTRWNGGEVPDKVDRHVVPNGEGDDVVITFDPDFRGVKFAEWEIWVRAPPTGARRPLACGVGF
jgi:hypothetical protein